MNIEVPEEVITGAEMPETKEPEHSFIKKRTFNKMLDAVSEIRSIAKGGKLATDTNFAHEAITLEELAHILANIESKADELEDLLCDVDDMMA